VSPTLLLFGRPSAGKTALVGALFQAAEQSPLLKGKLADVDSKLAKVARDAGTDKLAATTDELVSYPVKFEGGADEQSATLIDTSGALAQDYVLGTRKLDERTKLAQALFSADTLILVIDASAPQAQLERDFAAFAQFLRQMQEARGRRVDVSGLPVFLVLTKADRLAKPSDSRSTWLQRIEEGKRRIAEKFKEALDAADAPAFGAIQLHLWATASRRPTLTDAAAKGEPYGVAELFRQCLDAARVYHHERDRAGQRLSLTIMALGAAIGLLLLGAASLLLFQPNRDLSSLEDKIARLPAAGSPDRLRGSQAYLQAKLQELQRIERDPEYPHVPEPRRAALEEYARELSAYVHAFDAYQKAIKPPHLARNAEELARYEKALADFELPSAHAANWQDTRLAKRLQEARAEYAALHRAENELIGRIQEQIKETLRLREEGAKLGAAQRAGTLPPVKALDEWFRAVDRHLQPISLLPPGDPIPGVAGVTYERLDHLASVRQARAEWTQAQAVLRALADEIRARARKTAA
jgi:hypothetical protein